MESRTGSPARVAAFVLALLVAASGFAAQPVAQPDAATEANITRLTAAVLGKSQLAHRPLDRALASTFLDRYLDALDRERLLFLESDVAEFAAHRGTLARDTLSRGNNHVAHIVFERFLARIRERAAHTADLLENTTFDFTGNDVYMLDRTDAARPSDAAAARELWRQRLRVDYLQEKLEGKEADAIASRLTERSRRFVSIMEQMSRGEVLEIYLSALARVYDPHSDYLGHEQMDELAISMNLSLFGIGARLQSVDGHCKVVDLVPGGPAMRSGELGAGDRIVAVAQDEDEPVDVVDLPLSRIVSLIRGPKGTVVRLTVVPDGDGADAVRKTVRLVRDEIKLEEQRAKASIIDLPVDGGATRRLGIIDLPSFYADLGEQAGGRARGGAGDASATADVARLLAKLESEGVEGIVLDLRRNGGGSLQEAITLTGLFITRGPIVQTRGPGGDVDVAMDPDPAVVYEGPLLVLTSRLSASASEIVAGALQDYDRAIIVGDSSTFGKGTVQSIVPLGPMMERAGLQYAYDPGALKVTIRKFYRPGGASTQLRGVVPDIVVPSSSGVSAVGESELENPLPWDAVPAARYQPLSSVQPYIAALRAESARRVEQAEDFAFLRPELERLKARQETRTVSLNEAERREELARFEERRKAFREAVEAAGDNGAVTYELSVNDAALPGLPPPSKPGAGDAKPRPEGEPGNPESDPADAAPARDIVLNEARRILADYVALRERSPAPRTVRVPAPPLARNN